MITPATKMAFAGGLALVGALAARSTGFRDRTPPTIDPKAVAILEASDAAYRNAGTISAKYSQKSLRGDGAPAGSDSAIVRLGHPNYFYLETQQSYSYKMPEVKGNDTTWVERTNSSSSILASDGTHRYQVSLSERGASCTVSNVPPKNDAREIDTFNPIYWSFFDLGQWHIRSAVLGHWSSESRLNDPGLRSVEFVRTDDLNGISVNVIKWTYTIAYNYPDDDPVYTSLLFIGQKDGIVRRIETSATGPSNEYPATTVESIDDVVVGKGPAKAADFAYQPPADAKCTATDQEAGYHEGQFADLPNGTIAPDFTLVSSVGDSVKLSDYVKQHKVVLMNFWGYG